MRIGRVLGALSAATALFSSVPALAQYTHSGQTTIAYSSDVNTSLTSGSLIIGNQNSSQIAIDNNEIQARGTGGVAPLYLQAEGGDVLIGAGGNRLTIRPHQLRTEATALGLWVDNSNPLLIHRPTATTMHATFDVDELALWGRAYLYEGLSMVSPANVAGSGTACFSSGTVRNLGPCSSSIRFKRDVAPLATGLKLVLEMRPVSFTWKESGERDYGFIAEEALDVVPELVQKDGQGKISGFNYRHYTAVLTKAIQEQEETIGKLQQELEQSRAQLRELNATVATRIAELDRRVEDQKRRIDTLSSSSRSGD